MILHGAKPDAPVMIPGEELGQKCLMATQDREESFKAIAIFSNAKTPRQILKIKGFSRKRDNLRLRKVQNAV